MTLPTAPSHGSHAPDTVFGYVSARSQGEMPMHEAVGFESAAPFRADDGTRDRAKEYARAAGLTVTAESRLGFTVSGPPGAYEQLTGGRVETYEERQRVAMNQERFVTHLDIVGERQPDVRGMGAVPGEDAIEAVALEQPRIPMRVLPVAGTPPRVARFHLEVPGDVARLLGATKAHEHGETGRGVQVAMVDTGQFRHPFFAAQSYRVAPTVVLVPGADPREDPVGHGTGESANIFAVAPGATLHPYRASDQAGHLTAAMAAILRAKSDHPQVLTNSWGGDIRRFPPLGSPAQTDVMWGMEILDAVEQGIVVVFSAGNGQFSIEPQVPGVISAGGVFAGPDGKLQASNYASGYISPWVQGVVVPKVSGLVGMLPRAQYLMLPVPPGCEIDVAESRQAPGDTTTDTTSDHDGWALFSGTSAAAPQLAGAVAVLLGARPGLTPAQVAEALTVTATDITTGSCNPRFRNQARPGPDEATGAGLVNVSAALDFVLTRFP
ncbi:S8 family serine peptidase [Streptomyces sp. NBC_01340]|uniref:S8 family serine peptidase n=1 Tax=unclassified Streptomyces TaxID=2593676 RepID=UPI0022580CE9|nr:MULTISPECIES: S8 family serine peptidase [unclassified Streptomyces]MCX4452468.1 S8 family serine peptidase [Streptomyces sp. NBC_01719]MCX4491828.1 S8 family serine peptidase [Streptomyces sp. NBC_01728]MCX4593689.1 S8 family serine peptidase [Streptomyces sp. NBC_01549]WSI37025.1 S8 family serine peptidase [Streptomyces sp. NBC_01340]